MRFLCLCASLSSSSVSPLPPPSLGPVVAHITYETREMYNEVQVRYRRGRVSKGAAGSTLSNSGMPCGLYVYTVRVYRIPAYTCVYGGEYGVSTGCF